MPDSHGMPLDSDVCPTCPKLVLDHTLREFKEHHPARRLNLPYAEGPEESPTRAGDHGALSGALVVKAAAIGTNGAAGLPPALPALGFTFFGPDGMTEVAKALLVLDIEHMRGVRSLVGDAIDGAIKAARRR